MKTISFAILFVIAINLAGLAQSEKPYSVENLKKASQEELDVYLDKAMKLQKSGKTVTIIGGSILGGTALTVAGMAIADEGDWALAAAVVVFFGGVAGLGTMAVGIPMKATGKKRVERIHSIKGTAFDDIKLDVLPSAQYNLASQNYQPGVTLRIRF